MGLPRGPGDGESQGRRRAGWHLGLRRVFSHPAEIFQGALPFERWGWRGFVFKPEGGAFPALLVVLPLRGLKEAPSVACMSQDYHSALDTVIEAS